MATLASLRILLGLDSGDVSKGATRVRGELKGVQAEANKTRDAFTGIKQGIAAGFGLGGGIAAFNVAAQGARELTEFIGDSITRASALNETLSKSSVIFGQDAAAVEAWGRTAATAFGQSTGQAIEARATLGNLFKTMGLGQADVLGMSQNVVELASDLASFNNIGVDEALEKLRSGLVGQAEPLRTLGVQLTEANVKAKALEMGLVGVNGVLTESAKVQARYALILEQTGTAQGDFEKTSGGLANQQKTLEGNMANVAAEIGGVLLPVITDLAVSINTDVIPAIKDLGGAIGDIGGLFGELNTQLQPFADIINWIEEHTSGAGAGINALATDSFQFSMAGAAASAATTLWLDQVRILGNELADGTITQDQYNAAVADADRMYREALAGASDISKGLGDQRDELGRGTAAWDLQRASVMAATTAINDLGTAAVSVEPDLAGIAAGIGAIGNAADQSTIDITELILAMSRVRTDVGLGVSERIAAVGDSGLDTAGAQFTLDQIERERLAREAAARDGERMANEAAAEAKRRAAEAKRLTEEAARQAERDTADARRAKEEEWRAAQEVADRYFDRVHKGNLDAIDDIRDRRNAELDAANAAIQGPVDAERARLEAIRDAERESGLRGAVAAAETPGDLLAAQKDLQRFLEDERVEFMQGQADATVALNEAARENANAAADMAVAAEALRDIAARERFDPRVTRNADGSVARLDVADFLNDAPITVIVNIDGHQITEVVDRRLNTARVNISPTSVSTGSAR